MKNLTIRTKLTGILLATIVFISLIQGIKSIYSINDLSEKNIEQFREKSYINKENELKNYVDVALKSIESYYQRTEKAKIEQEVSEELQKQTNLIFSIIDSTYKKYHGKISNKELQNKIIEVVSSSRYGESGYFWINDLSAKIIDHPIKPSLNGKDLSNFKDKNGKNIFTEFAKVSKENGEGFVSYVWEKPGFTTPQDKISFVKLFKPYNWVIGTGSYLDDVTSTMQKEALKTVSQMRYGDNGYFWINDEKPNMVMHPLKPALNGTDISTIQDPNGVYIFKEMVKVSKDKEGGIVKYSWDKGGSNIQPKLSYVKEFKEWGWIVGTGIYIDDIEKEIQIMQEEAYDTIVSMIIKICITIIITSILTSIVVTLFFNKIIIKPLKKFQDGLLGFFKFLNKESTSIDALPIQYNDEIGLMSKVVNENITQTKKLIDQDNELLDEVKEVVEKMHKGFLKQSITKSTSNQSLEELKNLLNSMLKMLSNDICEDINKINHTLENYSKLDFRDRIENDNGGVAKGLNNLAEIITQMLVENKSNGLSLEQSSAILLENVNILNRNSNEAAAALEETAAALEEITSNITSNTNNITQMAKIANEVTDSSKEGEDLANNTTKAMDEINDEITAISEAITVIDQIAFQTNILSLNAAVEAATAGEAGKGFAVVAGEVRNLASRSAEAANEIKALVENATVKSNSGKSISSKMIQGYGKLSENISKTIDLIKDVESSSKEQQLGIEQINDAVNSLDQQTQQNAMIASQTHDVALETDTIAKLVVKDADAKEFNGKDMSKRKEPLDIEYKGKEKRKREKVIKETLHKDRKEHPEYQNKKNTKQQSTPANLQVVEATTQTTEDEWASF